MDVRISRLRTKLGEDPKNPRLIKTDPTARATSSSATSVGAEDQTALPPRPGPATPVTRSPSSVSLGEIVGNPPDRGHEEHPDRHQPGKVRRVMQRAGGHRPPAPAPRPSAASRSAACIASSIGNRRKVMAQPFRRSRGSRFPWPTSSSNLTDRGLPSGPACPRRYPATEARTPARPGTTDCEPGWKPDMPHDGPDRIGRHEYWRSAPPAGWRSLPPR